MKTRTYLVSVGIALGLFLLIAPPVVMTQRIDDLYLRVRTLENDLRDTNIAFVNYQATVISDLQNRITALEGKAAEMPVYPFLIFEQVGDRWEFVGVRMGEGHEPGYIPNFTFDPDPMLCSVIPEAFTERADVPPGEVLELLCSTPDVEG